MTSLFDKLNLRPFERRLVVVVGIVLFIVVQIWFVWPHFGDLKKMDVRRAKAQQTVKDFQAELAQKDKYQKEIAILQGEGLDVPSENQATELMRTIEQQARSTQVVITSSARPTTATNQFFLERSQTITAAATEESLVNFLFNLGSGNSLIRVRELSLRRDPSQMKLAANIKLVASYQKAAARKPAPATPVTNAAPARVESKPAPPKPSTSTKK
jgi:Tfp pilus assembly protein PilO